MGILLFCALLANFTALLLSWAVAALRTPISSYADLGQVSLLVSFQFSWVLWITFFLEMSFGRVGRYITAFSVYFSLAGIVVVYLVLVGNLLHDLVPIAPRGFWTLVSAAVVLPGTIPLPPTSLIFSGPHIVSRCTFYQERERSFVDWLCCHRHYPRCDACMTFPFPQFIDMILLSQNHTAFVQVAISLSTAFWASEMRNNSTDKQTIFITQTVVGSHVFLILFLLIFEIGIPKYYVGT